MAGHKEEEKTGNYRGDDVLFKMRFFVFFVFLFDLIQIPFLLQLLKDSLEPSKMRDCSVFSTFSIPLV